MRIKWLIIFGSGGMLYQCFSKCYDAIVQSTLNYGARINGIRTFSCIDTVQDSV